jgi:ferredoxin--NADP+ reductase
MNLYEYDFSNLRIANVLATDRITPVEDPVEVRHLVLEVPEEQMDYVEGQSIGVLVPGPHDFGDAYHFRLYSIASPRHGEAGRPNTFSICVRRCYYIDEVSGEKYPGLASNYLCNAEPGDTIQIAGPYGQRFKVPDDSTSNLVMVGVGTGIAPFRAFVKHIYEERGGWKGQVRLFYGAKTGMELLYMNDVRRDLALYYDEKSFKAFEAVSPRPHFDAPPDLERVISENAQEIWEMVKAPNTYVFVAGLSDAARNFAKAMVWAAGSKELWKAEYDKLVEEGRYSELLYE